MKKIVFTNGCFDILHPGHVDLLTKARNLGTRLIVGINSDESVRRIKGSERPFIDQQSRREVLLGLKSVDEVVIFDEPTPENLIKKISPDVLVKGGDWKISEIIGADFVLKNGGEVFSLPLKEGFSTTQIAGKIRGEKETSFNSFPKDSSVFEHLREDEKVIFENLRKRSKLFDLTAANDLRVIAECADLIFETLRSGSKIFFCGDAGNATVAEYLATVFSECSGKECVCFSAIDLTADNAVATGAEKDYQPGKDYSSRKTEEIADERDLLIAVSSGGDSSEIIAAVMKSRKKNRKVLGMTGAKGKKLASLCDASVLISSEEEAHIREAHIAVGHIWCEMINQKVGQA